MSGLSDIVGKKLLITGAASGLGAFYAESFLQEGAKSVAIVDIAEEAGKSTADRLNSIYPNKVKFYKCDVGNEDDITKTFDDVVHDFKRVDVIINNAGLLSETPATWRKACEINWLGKVSLTLKGLKHMRKDKGGNGGTIVNISSAAALGKSRFFPIYSGCKMAVLHFSQTLAVNPFHDYTGVRILTICLTATSTPMMQDVSARAYDEMDAEETQKYNNIRCQKPESAVAAFIKMFKEGANGSIWLSAQDRPAQDITQHMDGVFQGFGNIMYPEDSK